MRSSLNPFVFRVSAIYFEPSVQLCEPLTIHERLKETAHFESIIRSAQTSQKTQFDYTVNVRIDALQQAHLISCVRQEKAHHLGDIVATEDKARLAASRIELHKFLAYQNEQKAYLIAKLAARDQAR